MNKNFSLDWRIVPRAVAAAAMALLIGAGVQSSAGASATPVAFAGFATMGHSVITSRGPAFITGHIGPMDTVTIPGSGTQGFLSNNGNGSSTLYTPGGVPQTVFTPR